MKRVKDRRESYISENLKGLPVDLSTTIPGITPKIWAEIEKDKRQTIRIRRAVKSSLLSTGWFEKLRKPIHANERSGIFYPLVGGLAILVAVGELEFGIRHGKDIKELYELMKRTRLPNSKRKSS